MKITVIPTAKDIDKENLIDTAAVVIDVLRATSVIITALNNRAKEVIPTYTLKEAKEHGRLLDVLLGGERAGHKQVGFDFGNSPLEYIKEKVHTKTIVITTTNGTRAIKNSEKAKKIYIGSFLNAKAVAHKLKEERDVTLVCSGTDDLFSIEDGVCAGYIISLLKKNKEDSLNDMALACYMLYQSTKEDFHTLLKQCSHYQYLEKIGYSKDLEYCLQPDIIEIVPEYKQGKIII